jgi:hypothetical protein
MAMVVLAVLTVAVAAAPAADSPEAVTVAGHVVCAKCSLKVAGLEHCQNVVVSEEGSQRKELWLVNNDVNQAFGDVCTGKRPVSVTGTLESRDGKAWLTPSKIEPR